ncbi:MAG TPA: MotA/TolQ/ExbB proton channel family protein [Longimicrobiaceae bacterium]|nr:MotA/TolQ/ExbB proton channel family protein [Longimicrobiaceae bacterium]
MTAAAILLQGASSPAPINEFAASWDMIVHGTPSTKIIIGLLAIMSLASWALIVWKMVQFRRVRREADRFNGELERAERLDDAYQHVQALPESPFSRVFRRGVDFFSELRPAAARAGSEVRGLSPAQLEVLRLVLEKEEGEERDHLSHGVYWLAIISTVSPLFGLLGTVLGVMHSFVAVAQAGSSSISAVAPGVAEALITTAAGLVVAIPAAMAYNYFVAKLNLLMNELEGFSSEFIGTLAREGRV